MTLPLPIMDYQRFGPCSLDEANGLLSEYHYLGPVGGAVVAIYGERIPGTGEAIQATVWKRPTARMLPADGTMLELSRWVITPKCDANAGSRLMGRVRRWIRQTLPEVTTLVSYSELGKHSGGLYRASGWYEWPTHHTDRYHANGVGYPSGHGSWDGVTRQSPKERWRIDL